MKAAFPAAFVFMSAILAPTVALAGETITTNQRNPINIRAIVQFDRNKDTNYVVNQTGLYNSVGTVNLGTGGYTSVYQSGQANRALVGQYGNGQTAILEQIQNGRGVFSQLGTLSR
jgi:hypothetical protein